MIISTVELLVKTFIKGCLVTAHHSTFIQASPSKELISFILRQPFQLKLQSLMIISDKTLCLHILPLPLVGLRFRHFEVLGIND